MTHPLFLINISFLLVQTTIVNRRIQQCEIGTELLLVQQLSCLPGLGLFSNPGDPACFPSQEIQPLAPRSVCGKGVRGWGAESGGPHSGGHGCRRRGMHGRAHFLQFPSQGCLLPLSKGRRFPR